MKNKEQLCPKCNIFMDLIKAEINLATDEKILRYKCPSCKFELGLKEPIID